MDTNDIPVSHPSNWQPITNKEQLAILGKLGEEASELATAIFRCIIQGLDEREPATGKVNRAWLSEEIADVAAMARMTVQRLALNEKEILERADRKVVFKTFWYEALAEAERLGLPLIPHQVYFDIRQRNFYDNATHIDMGEQFCRRWIHRCGEFPQGPDEDLR